MKTERCPQCETKERQLRDGLTNAGSQRFRCKACGFRYTPRPQPVGYDDEVRLQAVTLYLEGFSYRTVGRILNINHQTVCNWVKKSEVFMSDDIPSSISELAEWDGFLE